MPGQPIQITITGSNPDTGILTFRDDENTNKGNTHARRGNQIIWHIHPGSGVSSITLIRMKLATPSTNIFVANDPQPVGNGAGRNWSGQISPAAAIDAEYNYDVLWTDTNGGAHTFDPMIKVNP
jgi:hypothetical protein